MHALVTGLAAAIVPGVLSAIVTRALMFAVAALTNTGPELDPVNSIGIAIFYIMLLLPGCLALAFARGRWPWLVFGVGVVLLVWQAISIGLQETAAASDMTALRWTGLVLVLLAMLMTYAAQVAASARLARRRRATAASRRGWHRTQLAR